MLSVQGRKLGISSYFHDFDIRISNTEVYQTCYTFDLSRTFSINRILFPPFNGLQLNTQLLNFGSHVVTNHSETAKSCQNHQAIRRPLAGHRKIVTPIGDRHRIGVVVLALVNENYGIFDFVTHVFSLLCCYISTTKCWFIFTNKKR